MILSLLRFYFFTIHYWIINYNIFENHISIMSGFHGIMFPSFPPEAKYMITIESRGKAWWWGYLCQLARPFNWYSATRTNQRPKNFLGTSYILFILILINYYSLVLLIWELRVSAIIICLLFISVFWVICYT